MSDISQGSEPALRRAKLHPLLTAAAVAVILFAAAGIAVMVGWLPSPLAPRPADMSALDAFPPALPTDQTPALPAPISTASTPSTTQALPAPVQPQVAARPLAQSEPPHHRAAVPRPHAVTPPPAPVLVAQPAPAPAVRRRCNDCGVIEAIQEIKTPGQGTGLGGVAGGVLGGVLGNQVGGGDGRKAMTVLGAVGGALAGNQIERHTRAQTRYEITVRMNDGSSRVLSRDNPPTWHEGDRVRVEGNQLFEADDR